jgi:two-component system catabolic regulation response regulator CreB
LSREHSTLKKKILIVDDEPAIADTLAYVLRTDGFEPVCMGLGELALRAVQAGDFALVILDIGLPDISGFDVCRELRRQSNVPVIFLTARSEEVDRIVGLELGADDYVAKPFSPREVSSRVRAILRRARGSEPAPGTPAPLFEVDREGSRIAYAGTWLTLTRYEFLLLAALLERPGRVLSRAHLMERVWSDAEESLDRTVDAHVKTLRAKLRTVRDGDPIETHRGLGYSVRGDAA